MVGMRSGSSRTPATAKMKHRWIGALLTLPIGVMVSEAAYRIAQPSTLPLASGNCLVLALGAPSRPDGTASTLQRFRVKAAAATLQQRRCRGLLLTGGAVPTTGSRR
jgi:vancomycin permeability regulator SanA